VVRRGHVQEQAIQRAVKQAVRDADLAKATIGGYDARTIITKQGLNGLRV
jgi:hypothetical protein